MTGLRWVLEYEGSYQDVIKFYDENLPEKKSKKPFTSSGKVAFVRYEFKHGKTTFQIKILAYNNTYEIVEQYPATKANTQK